MEILKPPFFALSSSLFLSIFSFVSLSSQVSHVYSYEHVSNLYKEPFSISDVYNSNSNPNSETSSGVSLELSHAFNAKILKKLGLNTTDFRFHALLALRDSERHRDMESRHSHGLPVNKRRKMTEEEMEVYSTFPEIVKREMLATGTSSTTSNFPLIGSVFPTGLYHALIGLGTPEQTFNVVIDTGSVLTWVNCQPCESCITSQLQQLSRPFDASLSSTSSFVRCDVPECNLTAVVTSFALGDSCLNPQFGTGNCTYFISYNDGSSTAGPIINDQFWLTLYNSSQRVSVPISFGCGSKQDGYLLRNPAWTVLDAVDGLLGLGRSDASVPYFIAKNSTLGIRNIFTLCLRTGFGGGLLAFGTKHVPQKAIYTDLVPDSKYFHVKLARIFVGGLSLSVPPLAYGDVEKGNAVFDSGTTYTMLHPTIQKAILNLIKLRVGLTPSENYQNPAKAGYLCYKETEILSIESIAVLFPTISLQFASPGAFLNIPPEAYTFIATNPYREICTRLTAWNSTVPSVNFIIGDIWMRNIALVHDLEKNRIGWAPSLCSSL